MRRLPYSIIPAMASQGVVLLAVVVAVAVMSVSVASAPVDGGVLPAPAPVTGAAAVGRGVSGAGRGVLCRAVHPRRGWDHALGTRGSNGWNWFVDNLRFGHCSFWVVSGDRVVVLALCSFTFQGLFIYSDDEKHLSEEDEEE
ncbi:Os09g0550150 [Oryza sativa Japonica Group]|uniref:Os09g0550150 protein n=2 Tax=Oryza sativa subsp. japonica TaxID=39947 RepID=A0A0P0XQY4_ORYSJ|nr:hypothetical protein EE612_049349 [Oryza sativa]BAT09292.1 Os09g0550150 [Oryza sativa Japonica Group]